MTTGFEKNVARGELLQRAIVVHVLEVVSEFGCLRAQQLSVVEAGLTVERLLALAECQELLTVIDLEACATLVGVTAGQLVVRAQRELLRDPLPFARPQVRHEF